MKKIMLCFFLVSAFTVLSSAAAYAAEVEIDVGGVSKGIVVVNVSDAGGKTIKAQVEKDGSKYIYTLIKDHVNIPLQMGTGGYKIMVLENIGGDKYKSLASEEFSAESIDETEMYKASIPFIEYSVSNKAIPAYKIVADGKVGDAAVDSVYDDIVQNYRYDFDKVSTVKDDYVPVIDAVFEAKKGICYDYASLLGGALRSLDIPTKLVMGYSPEVPGYHAWNEVLISGEWVAVDSTYDALLVDAGYDYEMKRDKSQMKAVRIY